MGEAPGKARRAGKAPKRKQVLDSQFKAAGPSPAMLLERRMRDASKRCCSEEWAKDVAERGAKYPPPASNPATAMRVCTDRPCGGNGSNPDHTPIGVRHFPHYYLQRDTFGDVCDDCAEIRKAPRESSDNCDKRHRITTSSPTTLAQLELEARHGRLEERKLPSEDPHDLMAEILKDFPNFRKVRLTIKMHPTRNGRPA